MSTGDRHTVVWTPPEAARELGTLPVRLQTPSGDTVARGLSGVGFQAPEGKFYLGVTLPDGTEIIGDRLARIAAAGRVSLPSLEQEFSYSRLPGDVLGLEENNAGALSGLLVRIWRGDWIAAEDGTGHLQVSGELLHVPQEGLLLTTAGNPDQLLLTESGDVVRAHVIPWDRDLGDAGSAPAGMLVRPPEASGMPSFTSPVARDADSLAAFADVGRLDDALCLARAALSQAPDGGPRSLLHGLVSVYVMLRANDHAGLDERSAEVLELERGCPDALIQRIEVLARLGRHDEALPLLAESCGRGCPWFRSGMSYWLERLRFYLDVDAGAADFRLDADIRLQFEGQRASLTALCARMDFQRLFTVFNMPGPDGGRKG